MPDLLLPLLPITNQKLFAHLYSLLFLMLWLIILSFFPASLFLNKWFCFSIITAHSFWLSFNIIIFLAFIFQVLIIRSIIVTFIPYYPYYYASFSYIINSISLLWLISLALDDYLVSQLVWHVVPSYVYCLLLFKTEFDMLSEWYHLIDIGILSILLTFHLFYHIHSIGIYLSIPSSLFLLIQLLQPFIILLFGTSTINLIKVTNIDWSYCYISVY